MKDIIIYIAIFITTLIIIYISVYLYDSNKNKSEDYEYDSEKLDKDNNLLHITPAKKCTGGAFLDDLNCKNINENEKSCFSCQRRDGLVGRPVHFEFTPLSDNKWRNPRCKELNKRAKCSTEDLMPATL